MNPPKIDTGRNMYPRSSSSSNNNGSIDSKRQRIASAVERQGGKGHTSAFLGQRSNAFPGQRSSASSVRSNRSVSSTSRAGSRKSASTYNRNRSNHRKSNHGLGISRSMRSSSSSSSGVRSIRGNGAPTPPPEAADSPPHILCAIGENLARETCVVSIDLSAPFLLTVIKQSNGQSYAETIACLNVLRPHEVLLNEGRYHSPLAQKILGYFDVQRLQKQKKQAELETKKQQEEAGSNTDTAKAIAKERGKSPRESHRDVEETVVKFISRSFFDQTKGAGLLKKLARQDTYDSTLVDEYILLSSSHAVLHYAQVTLGAVAFARHSLDVRVHTGGHNHNKMEIDRSTILQLELLTNNSGSSSNRSSTRKDTLIATMDCTKTGVGHRLLRTTLMAPPCRLDTINARLDLVDTFLQHEELFYSTLQQLQNLSSLDKMLTNIVVIPPMMQNLSEQQRQQRRQELGLALDSHRSVANNANTNTNANTSEASVIPEAKRSSMSSASGKTNASNERIASKGISALICIKSTLACVPNLASILKSHLERIEGNGNAKPSTDSQIKQQQQAATDEATIATAKTSLLMGLGVAKGQGSPSTSTSTTSTTFTQHQLLHAIVFALTQPELEVVRETINGAFTKSTSFTKNANAMKHQECFALKSSDDNGLMDVLRKAFLSNVDDIYRKADEYAEVHGISHVGVKYSAARGYYLSLPVEMASNLPNEFIQPSKSGRHILCTTEEVQSLNTRALDNIQDLLLFTHEKIQEVLEMARSKYDALARLSDAIALLDLCHSFADKVTLSKRPWTRPTLADGGVGATVDSENGGSEGNDIGDSANGDSNIGASSTDYAIAICNGRYGIEIGDDNFTDGGPGKWISNDTYASLSKNLTIISGINGSGKSTYLKQIGIIVLLAHCGSYVPAEEALIPLTNRLCARMMTADDQENNISSFMLEMKETAFICKNASSRSLILLDELGRATSNEDGVAIAWAVAENLLAKGALTFFVTHYPQLCQMSNAYASVQNQHMKASISDDGEGRIRYTHKIGIGPCDATSNYGVEMAASCGWPSDVVEEARAIESSLKGKLAEAPLCDESNNIEKEIRQKKLLKATVAKLVNCVTSECEPNMGALRTALQEMKVSLLNEIPKEDVMRLLGRNTSVERKSEAESPK